MVPDLKVQSSVEDLKRIGDLNTEYPLSQLTICLGFFFVYFLEEISHWFLSKVPKDCEPAITKKVNNFTKASVSPLDTSETASNAFMIEDSYKKVEKQYENETEKEDEVSKEMVTLEEENRKNTVYDTLSLNSEAAKQRAEELDVPKELIEENDEKVEKEITDKQHMMRGVLIVVALCFHAVFEGLAIGLQKSTADIWFLFTAVSIHSATILFCISLELLLAKSRVSFIYTQMIFLALASPFGVLLGLVVTQKYDTETKSKSMAVVLLEGLSAGTILYITFFEVLNREKERRVYRVYRAFCIIGGFSLMAFLQYLEVYGFYHSSYQNATMSSSAII
ncbi:unnamed protein product [Acanthoscelides obtectus]|uniref:Uncharacterized protein n=1 Tax=Acanthoscelides obtectus TaxID=200917 RepID=A0A9P0LNN1_ACAOB|nr:unnamed protein product [Acanthoscelides obtectus]CAK1657364.1 Zinc transporter ZIP1 [Acanthoscelides obtectus]